ncbi:MAG: type II toxin-antitoxin system death-on-curing family toxin [Patescibacteria group bacterium]|nr:type II toxin-antitoxin system death-on-curing family toxin [Patescibacteria group bacterium]
MKKITIQEVEYIAYQLAQKQMEWDEPIPDFGTRYPGKLESCLSSAFQTYGKRELYTTFIDKAAITFYLMIKNHPFLNGNKRIAVTTLLTFLYLNNKWLSVTDSQLYQMAVWVAQSQPQVKDGTVLAIKEFIKKNLANV